jgi:hypothetical protein
MLCDALRETSMRAEKTYERPAVLKSGLRFHAKLRNEEEKWRQLKDLSNVGSRFGSYPLPVMLRERLTVA